MSSVTVFTSITVINITALWKRFEHRHAFIPLSEEIQMSHPETLQLCLIYLNLVILA